MKLIKNKAKSCSYGGKRSLDSVKYIVIHNTGNRHDTAAGNGNYFARNNTRAAGAHYFVDRAGLIVESIPMNLVAWSVGGFFTQKNGAGSLYKKCTNSNSVSIELCDIVDLYPSSAQVDATRELVRYIQGKCKNAKTIIRHWDVNGKSCPLIMSGKGNANWSKFKKAITRSTAVTTDKLNMRVGGGTEYRVIATIPKGKTVTVLQAGHWSKVSYGGKTGYVNSRYLK